MKHIGKMIRIARKTAGLSQMALAERIGISYQQVQKYENGSSEISISRLFQIAHALNMTVGNFILDDDKAMVSESAGLYGMITDDEIELLRLFRSIKNKKMKEGLLAAIKSMAGAPGKKDKGKKTKAQAS